MEEEPSEEARILREKLAGLNRVADAVAMVKSAHGGDWKLHGDQMQPYMEHVVLMLALYNALEGFARHVVVEHSKLLGVSVDQFLDDYVQAIAANPNVSKPPDDRPTTHPQHSRAPAGACSTLTLLMRQPVWDSRLRGSCFTDEGWSREAGPLEKGWRMKRPTAPRFRGNQFRECG